MRKINNTLIFLCCLATACILVRDLNNGSVDLARIAGSSSILLVLFLPRIIKKILKVDFTDEMELVYILFIILAQFAGCILRLYNNIWWYDLFAHFTSGILTAILALAVLGWFKIYNPKNKAFNAFFIISFALMVAVIWEFMEYGVDVFLHLNVQHSLETGVSDTMEDMLVAFIGSIIVSITYLVQGKNGFLNKVVSRK